MMAFNLWQTRPLRLILLGTGILSLVCGVWGGLIRVPVNLPLPVSHANWISFHGPLMVCGFLGTVIGLERAVGLGRPWNYFAPLLTGVGTLMVAAGSLGKVPLILITVGSAWFVVVAGRVVQLQHALFTGVMALGALTWLVGNILWLQAWPLHRVVPWWVAFLALTIVGERLDLSRFQKPSRWSRPVFYVGLTVFAAGVLISSLHQVEGERLTGLGLIGIAAWLGRFDMARRTVRQQGLTRFMAVCLLSGYAWLAVAGFCMMWFSPLSSGVRYDATLHAFFVGFVFSMIFAHAPIIFPAVLRFQPSYRQAFYIHVVLLHAALALRVGADLAGWAEGRQWGSIGNAVAFAAFLLNTVLAFIFPAPSQRPSPASV